MKYYKILNEKENHYGIQYKTGLNVDVCFASDDILAFLSMGYWIREVTLPKGEEVYENPSENGEPRKYKAHRVILGERRKITPDVIKELVNEGANIHARDDSALRWASARGHLDIVKYLIEHGANIHAGNDLALHLASHYEHLEIVEYLKSRDI